MALWKKPGRHYKGARLYQTLESATILGVIVNFLLGTGANASGDKRRNFLISTFIGKKSAPGDGSKAEGSWQIFSSQREFSLSSNLPGRRENKRLISTLETEISTPVEISNKKHLL